MKIISRHPFAVPFMTFAVLIIALGAVYGVARGTHHLPVRTKDAKIVIVSYDHQKLLVPTRERTVGALLQKLHIQLDKGDVVEPAATTTIDQDEFRINVYRALPVEIIDGDHKTFTFSAATTARSIAQQSGQVVYPEDVVSTSPTEDFLRTGAIGEEVVISRATPINVDLYGTPVVLRTHATTVGGLLKEKHIRLAKNDQVVPAVNSPIVAGQQVSFLRTGTKVVTVTEQIPTPVQTIIDESLAYGTNAVRQQGSPGEQVVTYQVQIENNVEKSRTVIQKVVNKEPVTQIVVIGSSLSGIKGDMALAGIAPSDYDYVDYIISHESGWCPTKAQGEHYCPPQPDNADTPNGYGLCQSTPGYKMASAGEDWRTNPVTQLRWCSGYAHSRYGSWGAAYSHWLSYHNW